MRVFPVADSHADERRTLTAFRPSTDFPMAVEAKVLVTTQASVKLGNHSHPYHEGFFLVAGSCVVRTWTKVGGLQMRELVAPTMFLLEPNEEHLLTCQNGMILVGYVPVEFREQNHIPATHLG